MADGVPGDNPLLEMKKISKTFPENLVEANRNISIALHAGEIHALVGENGAGKSTLMNILSGIITPDEGEIVIEGRTVSFSSPHEALNSGIGMVHQHPYAIPEFTVWENIILGQEPTRLLSLNKRRSFEKIKNLLKRYDLPLQPDSPTADVSAGELRRAAVVSVLLRNIRVLILDEPTVAFTDQETESFFRFLKTLAGEGKGILFISHKLKEVTTIADTVTVIKNGTVVITTPAAEISEQTLSHMMVGEKANCPVKNRTDADGKRFADQGGGKEANPRWGQDVPPVLEVEKIGVKQRGYRLLENITFQLFPGEIVAVTGIREFGLEILEDIITGMKRADTGVVKISGRPCEAGKPGKLRKKGVAYIPTDRMDRGSAIEASLWENIVLHRLKEVSRAGIFSRHEVRRYSAERQREFTINGTPDQPLSTLSGGHLNKVVTARELSFRSTLLVVSEPSWGLDFRSAEEFYDRLLRIKKEGTGILVFSTFLEEVLHLADRIIVLYRGTVAADLPNIHLDKKIVGEYMLGLRGGGDGAA